MSRGTELGTLEDIVKFILANPIGNRQERAVIKWITERRGIKERAVQKAIWTLKQSGILKKEMTHLLTDKGEERISLLTIDLGEVEMRHNELKLERYRNKIYYLPEKERTGLILQKRAVLLREWAEKDQEIKRLLDWSAKRMLEKNLKATDDLHNYMWNLEVGLTMDYLKSWKQRGSL